MTDKGQKKKSPWRFVFLAAAGYGLWELLGNLIARILYLYLQDPVLLSGYAASIGVIGGADGPTAVFVTTSASAQWALPLILLVIGLLGFLYLKQSRQK